MRATVAAECMKVSYLASGSGGPGLRTVLRRVIAACPGNLVFIGNRPDAGQCG